MPHYDAEVDPLLCTGSRECILIAPHVFTYSDQVIASVVRGGPFADDDAVIEAALRCPASAIVVTDADTGEQLAP